jgi:hypothetical protein
MRAVTWCVVLLAAAVTLVLADTEQATFRSSTRTVSVPVSVHDDRGRLVTGLQADDFELFEDGYHVPIAQFTSDPQPITLTLMFDTSTSARELPETFSGLVEELKQQYLLGFSSSKMDGKVHTIDVQLRRADLRATARRGYQAGTQ